LDLLAFIAQIIDSLAWPILVAWFIYLFRDSLSAQFTRLTKVKYKDFVAEFNNDLEQIELPTEPDKPSAIENLGDEKTISLSEMAEVAPRAAILEAWAMIERSTRMYLASIGVDKRMSYQGLRKLPAAHQQPLKHILGPYQELRVLRNRAAHVHDDVLTTSVAAKYVALATRIDSEIRDASGS
jgi:ABC-type siderophore export system fused ATPase/permease subunit